MKSIIINAAQIVTPIGRSAKKGRNMGKLEIIENGGVYCEDGIISEVGTTDDILKKTGKTDEINVIDAEGKAVIPGFVDSHTHFIFGGYREEEFVSRLGGVPYIEILKNGGGIMDTVASTRKSGEKELFLHGKARLRKMLSQGITTAEGKSGYGLDKETEIRQLKVMKKLNEVQPVDIVTTYLGGHAVRENLTPEEYIDFMTDEVMPLITDENLAEFCDVFCENSVFSVEESRKLLTRAKEMGFKLKIHADEIEALGGSELAGELGAVSADHLLMISDEGIEALIKNNVTATLLPCTAFCLRKPYAPARKIIDKGGAVALASDMNPGSCFSNSVPLLLALAVMNMNMTIEEALTGLTLNGAAALDRAHMLGTIEKGKKADMLILEYPSYKFLVYNTGVNIVERVIKCGEVVYDNKDH